MPNCKNCGTRIEKFNKDICPICGCPEPLKEVESNTVEITSEISLCNDELKYKARSKLLTFVLFAFIGWTGIGFFYLKKKQSALIYLLTNILIFGILFVIFKFGIQMGLNNSIILPTIVIYILNLIKSFYFLLKKDIKDGNGDFLK